MFGLHLRGLKTPSLLEKMSGSIWGGLKLFPPTRLLTNFQCFLLSFLRHWSRLFVFFNWRYSWLEYVDNFQKFLPNNYLEISPNLDFSKKWGKIQKKNNFLNPRAKQYKASWTNLKSFNINHKGYKLANLFHGNTYINFTEVNILHGFMHFLFKRVTLASIETLKHNWTSYKHFFPWIVF